MTGAVIDFFEPFPEHSHSDTAAIDAGHGFHHTLMSDSIMVRSAITSAIVPDQTIRPLSMTN